MWASGTYPLILDHPLRDGFDVGSLAVRLGPHVDSPFLAGLAFGQNGRVVRSEDEKAAAITRVSDVVVAQQVPAIEQQQQAGHVPRRIEAVEIAFGGMAKIGARDPLRRADDRSDPAIEPDHRLANRSSLRLCR